MSIGFLFWLLMILWAVFGAWQGYGVALTPAGRPIIIGNILLFLLFLLLGLHAFGWPIRT